MPLRIPRSLAQQVGSHTVWCCCGTAGCLQVAHLNLPGSDMFRKLRQLKEEKGGLTSQDEKHYAQIRRSLEAEVLAHADVVSTPASTTLKDAVPQDSILRLE